MAKCLIGVVSIAPSNAATGEPVTHREISVECGEKVPGAPVIATLRNGDVVHGTIVQYRDYPQQYMLIQED